MSRKQQEALTLSDLDRDELLALIDRCCGPMRFQQADLISIKHESAQKKTEAAFATRETAFDHWIELCQARNQQTRSTRAGELKYLTACRAASDAEAALKRADKNLERIRADEERLWAAWMKEANL